MSNEPTPYEPLNSEIQPEHRVNALFDTILFRTTEERVFPLPDAKPEDAIIRPSESDEERDRRLGRYEPLRVIEVLGVGNPNESGLVPGDRILLSPNAPRVIIRSVPYAWNDDGKVTKKTDYCLLFQPSNYIFASINSWEEHNRQCG